MFELTITSGLFLVCLLCGPLLMLRNRTFRRWAFLLVNIGIFGLYLDNWQSATAMLLFAAFPYCYLVLILRWKIPIWPAIVIQVGGFIYINNYTWLLDSIKIASPSYLYIIGTSYILFRQIDVLLQVNARLVEKVPIIDYLNYLFSFWTLLAGPIQRYKQFIQTFYADKNPLNTKDTLACFHRAANGMLKILILGTLFKYISDTSYSHVVNDDHSLKYIAYIYVTYPLFVYFNFSGYCDVVIAMAKWAGFEIPENFNRPYLARDLIEMWNRWHITLSQWIRDYLYQPLFRYLISGKRSKYVKVSQYVSIFLTFFIAGVWHGANMGLVIFGLLQGFGVAMSMIYRDQAKKRLGKQRYNRYYENKWVANIERVVTLGFFFFTFLFFEYPIPHIVNGLLTGLRGII